MTAHGGVIISKKPLYALLFAQFLSAFVDNMILFITIAIISRDQYPAYYLPLIQSAFLFAYIVLAPWVGRFADKHPKSQVLIVGNILKALGIVMLLLRINPVLSYAVVGIGAVVYSPAKYGILPELTSGEDELLKANSQLESFTILAILLGSVAGGYLSGISILVSLVVCLVLYGASVLFNLLIPKRSGNYAITYANAVKEFGQDSLVLFQNTQSRYSLIGTGAFWQASAVLRLILIAWVPLALGIKDSFYISAIVAATGIGVAVGAVLTPLLVSVQTYTRTVFYGFAMGLCVFVFPFLHSWILTVLFLLIIGCLGGIFIVPMNTCLQNVGHASIGTGKTIAIQNFVENSFMFVGVGAYTLASYMKIGVNTSIFAAGAALLLFVCYMFVSQLRSRL